MKNKARIDTMDQGTKMQVRRVDYLGKIHFDENRKAQGCYAKLVKTADEHGKSTGTFLDVQAFIGRTGVQIYGDSEGNQWGEFRSDVEVRKSLSSFEMVVVTNDHPDEFVSGKNVRDVQVGHGGSDVTLEQHGDVFLMKTRLRITDSTALEDIQGGKAELSCGYGAEVIVDSGVAPNGTPFSGRQTNIVGNHVAIVDRGRAGEACRLLVGHGDAFSIEGEMPKEDLPIQDVKNGKPLFGEDPDEDVEEEEDGTMQEGKQKSPADKPKKDEEKPVVQSNDSELRAELDANRVEMAQMKKDQAKQIDARVNLLSHARLIKGSGYVTDGLPELQIQSDVILAVLGESIKDSIEANKDDAGYMRCLFEQAVKRHSTDASEQFSMDTHIFSSHIDGANKEDWTTALVDMERKSLEDRRGVA